MRLVVGVADVLPKHVARRILQPAFGLDTAVRLTVPRREAGRPADGARGPPARRRAGRRAGRPARVGARVQPPARRVRRRARGTPALAKRYKRRFPQGLDGAPMLLPTPGTMLRRSLDQWLETAGIRPAIIAELEDSALMTAFGQAGVGLFPCTRSSRRGVPAVRRARSSAPCPTCASGSTRSRRSGG
jgi:LysR family transcriptional activator of nhaA